MFSKLNTLALFFIPIGLISLILACGKDNTFGELKIGVIVPLTGGAADFGKWARNGVELALSELEKENKYQKYRFIAVYEDHQMDSKLALSAFNKLYDVDKPIAIITNGSGAVLTIAPRAERTRTVQMNHAAVSPAIRHAGKYTFTLVNDADVETKEIARLAYHSLGIKRLAVLYANTSYGVGTKDAIVKSFSEIGGEILETVAFAENSTDFRPFILQLKRANPSAVYFAATIKDSGRILNQAYELGFQTQWLSYNAFESPEVVAIAGDAANGVIYTSSNLFDFPDPGEKPRQFLESYLKKYKERPNLYAATAYDAVNLITYGYSISDGTKEGLQKAIASIKNYQGASGVISFDSDGYVYKPVFLKTVRDGQFVLYN